MILTMRTDKPESEIGLFDGPQQITYEKWEAHRQLAETIHAKIRTLLADQGKELKDLTGIVIYRGPGSFTGLRIGMSVGNALAYSLDIPIAAADGEGWQAHGIASVQKHPSRVPVTPEYGLAPNITKPRK